MRTDERREHLLRSGVELLAVHSPEEVSIEEIAAAAGVSKGLLYHYFPTKKDFILAAIERGQRQLAERLRPDPALPPADQLDASLEAFLDYVEEHPSAYTAIFRGAGGDQDVATALDAGRAEQLETLMVSLRDSDISPLDTSPSPQLETAMQGWLYFVEGAVLRWLENGGMSRAELHALLRSAIVGSLLAAEAAGALQDSRH